jgi:hypothetical protein
MLSSILQRKGKGTMTSGINREPEVCQRKKWYPNYSSANRAAIRLRNNTSDPVHAFPCDVCGGAHVGKTERIRYYRDERLDKERDSDRKAMRGSRRKKRIEPDTYDLD